jgi:hypothetical protein
VRCFNCGKQTRFLSKHCSHCGQDFSPYVHLPGVLLGIIGSLIGFTFFMVPGALLGGLIGIAIYGLGFRMLQTNRYGRGWPPIY